MRVATIGVVLFAAAFSRASAPPSGPAHLLRDINPSPGFERASLPQSFVEFDGFTLFTAQTPATGREMWRTDGTEAGTFLLKDTWPDIFGGVLNFPAARVGNVAYFAAVDPEHGAELWTSDGTFAGTHLVKDIVPGRVGGLPVSASTPLQSAPGGGLLYFLANDGSHGVELWRSDGTEAGTFLLKDICPGVCTPFTFPHFLQLEGRAIGDTLFFIAGDNLWKTDGSTDGTVLVTDPVGSVSSLLGETHGLLLFVADDGSTGQELWRSDGTEGGTYVLLDIQEGPSASFPRFGVSFDGDLYFVAYNGAAFPLWRTDGTSTEIVADHAVAIIGGFGGKLYFIGFDQVHGSELWVTDGTPGGSGLVREVVPGPNGFPPVGGFTFAGGTLYFVAGVGEIWKTDGTEAGTVPVGGDAITFSSPRMRAAGSHLYFERQDAAHGFEPWVTDGTAAGTMILRDIHPGTLSSQSNSVPGRIGARVLFSADDGVNGFELWATDGTPEGTSLVSDVNPLQRTATSNSIFAGVLGNRVLLVADDGVHGQEPWITDGTEEGTRLLTDIRPGPGSSSGGGAAPWHGQVYFPADDGTHGAELWVTDGTETGTRLVGDVAPGPASLGANWLTPLDSVIVFTAQDDLHGAEVWTSDGTEAGTRLLKDVNPGPAGSYPTWLVRCGDAVFFYAYGETQALLGRTDGTEAGTIEIPLPFPLEITDRPIVYKDALWFFVSDYNNPGALWRSDGTIAGTGPVAAVDPEVGFQFGVAGDLLYFAGQVYEDGGTELWRSDGTAAGTYRLKEIRPGQGGGQPQDLTAVGSTLFFTADDGIHGREVWKTDGTEAGTVMVSDIEPGRFSSVPTNLREVDGVVLFSAGLDAEGLELWRTDGTETGTYLVQDLLPGPQYSTPGGFVTIGSRVFFNAIDDLAGREPWVARAAILTRQPVRAVRDLADDVRALALPSGIENSLIAKLDAAARALERPNGSRVASKQLLAFANEVEAQIPPISASAAADLLEFVEEIQGLFGASVPSPPRESLRPFGEPSVRLNRPR